MLTNMEMIKRTIIYITRQFLIITFIFMLLSCNSKHVNIDNLLTGQYPDYHILGINELDSTALNYFLKKYHGQEPGILKEDFDNNGHKDIAAILKADNTNTVKFVVFLCLSDTKCVVSYELDISNYYDMVYITIVKKDTIISQVESVDRKIRLQPKITNPGIKLTYFGKGAIVIYWDSKLKKMVSIQISD